MSGYVNPTVPNVADYTTFLTNELQIPATALPTNSPWITYAFNRGMAFTLPVCTVDAGDYVNTVYCCAAHVQLEITPDQPGQTYFAAARSKDGFGLVLTGTGVSASGSDQGTSSTLVVPESMKRLTFQDLQFAKTPWGRVWLGWGQDFGSIWGLT